MPDSYGWDEGKSPRNCWRGAGALWETNYEKRYGQLTGEECRGLSWHGHLQMITSTLSCLSSVLFVVPAKFGNVRTAYKKKR